MATVGTIAINIGMRGTDKVRAELDKSGAMILNFQNKWANVGGAVTAATAALGAFRGVASGVGDAIGSMVKSASDLDESLNLVVTQFQAGAGTVIKASEEMADRFGVARAGWLQGVGSLGTVVEAMGRGEKATADMSVSLGKLAGDFASIRNMRIDDVLLALRSGLSGESEPLKNLGIFINDAAVKAEAFRSGIATVGAELTEGQKIQARYNLIMGQSGKVMGDMERNAGSVALQMAAVSGRIENMSADLGGAFTSVTEVVLGSLTSQLATVQGGFGETRQAIADWANSGVQYGGMVSNAIGTVGEAIAYIADAWKGVQLVFGVGSGAILGFIADIADAAARSAQIFDAITKAATGMSSGIGEAARTIADSLQASAVAQRDAIGRIWAEDSGAMAARDMAARMQKSADQIGRMKANAEGVGAAMQGVEQSAAATAAIAAEAELKKAEAAKASKAMAAVDTPEIRQSSALEFGSGEAMGAIFRSRNMNIDAGGEAQVKAINDVAGIQRQALAELKTIAGAFNFQVAKI